MSILEQLVNLYAPHICVGCGFEGSLLCSGCRTKLAPQTACCYRCNSPRRLGRTCSTCRHVTRLVSVNCVTSYSGLSKDLLWALKFDRAQAAAEIIGGVMAQAYSRSTPADALIVPIPTAMKRVRKRGYDQASLIARSYARHTGCQYAPLLLRYGSQEQKAAGRLERHQQLQGAYRLKDPTKVAGRRIILIDDVVTTGATLEQASAVLADAGAKAIAGLAFARA